MTKTECTNENHVFPVTAYKPDEEYNRSCQCGALGYQIKVTSDSSMPEDAIATDEEIEEELGIRYWIDMAKRLEKENRLLKKQPQF